MPNGMPNGNPNPMGNLNQGVNYMNPGQQPMPGAAPVPPVQPSMPGQSPVPPVQSQMPAGAPKPANNVNIVDKLKKNPVALVGIGVGVVAFIVAVIFGIKLLDPATSIVSKYMSGMKKFDAEKIAKLYDESIIEADYDGEVDDLVDELEEDFEDMEDEDYKITGYKIRECDAYSEDEVEEVADFFENYYDIDADDVKAVKNCWVKVNVDEDGDKGITYKSVTVIKIKNKWSLYR